MAPLPPPTPLMKPADIAEALALLSRVPVPGHAPRGAASAWAWPLAGLVLALIAAAVGALALALGLPPGIAAGLVLAGQVALTGGLHEDGLADCADGFWGASGRVRRLEIMKDSRVGSYGVIALVLGLGLRWVALAVLFEAGAVLAPLVAAAVLSRGSMAVVMAVLPNARGSGLAAGVGRPGRGTALAAVGLAVGVAFVATGWDGFAALFWAAVAVFGLALVARAKIGGQTGDVLGASQQVAEIAVLGCLAALG